MVKRFGESPIRWTVEEKARIVGLHKDGMTPRQIAERYGVRIGSINGILHRAKKAKTE